MLEENSIIYGKHAVKEALAMRPDIVRVVYIQTGADDAEILTMTKKGKIPCREVNAKKVGKMVGNDAVHQGLIAEIDSARLMEEYDDFITKLAVTPDTALVVLGEVQDPHNVGAIIRSAVAFGVSAVLIPEHRQAQVNGTIIKVSAGMAFRVPLVRIGNVNSTIADLKKRGFWVYGLDGEATESLENENFEKPSVLILGNEGTGIRQKTLEHCDISLRIPLSEKAESLNASVAGAVVLYAWSMKHPKALK